VEVLPLPEIRLEEGTIHRLGFHVITLLYVGPYGQALALHPLNLAWECLHVFTIRTEPHPLAGGRRTQALGGVLSQSHGGYSAFLVV
jgi:hypothetical protein